MTRLARIFLATSIASVITAIVLAFALINEAKGRSEAVQAVYKVGLQDGETYVRGQIIKSQIEQEIIKEAEAHIAEERL